MSAERVLIVEDEEEVAELVRDYLEREGYETRIATDGASAIEAYRTFQPHAAILDIMIPGLDGQEVCRAIRATSDIPLLMLSARDADIDKILSLGLGADDYVTKPFSPAELVARVKAHLRRYAGAVGSGAHHGAAGGGRPGSSTLTYGGLVIDAACRTVLLDGAEIALSVKEFDLLSFLAMHPGQVFTRERLVETVWKDTPYVDLNTVTVHVQRLREKLGESPSEPRFIQTVWGVGYRLAVRR